MLWYRYRTCLGSRGHPVFWCEDFPGRASCRTRARAGERAAAFGLGVYWQSGNPFYGSLGFWVAKIWKIIGLMVNKTTMSGKTPSTVVCSRNSEALKRLTLPARFRWSQRRDDLTGRRAVDNGVSRSAATMGRGTEHLLKPTRFKDPHETVTLLMNLTTALNSKP